MQAVIIDWSSTNLWVLILVVIVVAILRFYFEAKSDTYAGDIIGICQLILFVISLLGALNSIATDPIATGSWLVSGLLHIGTFFVIYFSSAVFYEED